MITLRPTVTSYPSAPFRLAGDVRRLLWLLTLLTLALAMLPGLASAQTGQVPSGGYSTFPVNSYISPNLQNVSNSNVIGRWVVYNSSGAIASDCYSAYPTNGWNVSGNAYGPVPNGYITPEVNGLTVTCPSGTTLGSGYSLYYWNTYDEYEEVGSFSVVSASGTLPPPQMLQANQANPAGLDGIGASVNLVLDLPSGATGFTLERSTSSGGPYAVVQNLTSDPSEAPASSGGTAVTDSGPFTAGTTYYYVAYATAPGQQSALSPQISYQYLPVPPNPVSASVRTGQVTLTWGASPGASAYTVEREGFTLQSGVVGTTYTDTAVTNGTTYYYNINSSCYLHNRQLSCQASILYASTVRKTFNSNPAGVTA